MHLAFSLKSAYNLIYSDCKTESLRRFFQSDGMFCFSAVSLSQFLSTNMILTSELWYGNSEVLQVARRHDQPKFWLSGHWTQFMSTEFVERAFSCRTISCRLNWELFNAKILSMLTQDTLFVSRVFRLVMSFSFFSPFYCILAYIV